MSDKYLWDKSGDPDPEVEGLEKLLGPFRHNRPAPEFPAAPRAPRRFSFLPLPGVGTATLAVAASVVLVVVGSWYALRESRPAWAVVRLAGTPRVGSSAIGESGRLAVGESLETDAASRARIEVGAIGEVEVEPNTRIRLVRARSTEHRLALDRGTMHAAIWAPPRLFFVNTPSAEAVDLGCRYTLQVDPSGAGLLHVTFGWVAFEQRGSESFVPAGAMCATRPGVGPGTPYFEDASVALRGALERLEFSAGDPAARADALRVVLAEARPRDALTLWHLLSRTEGLERARVYDRLAELVPPPKGVTREGILAGDRHMRDLWWDALGLGDTSWWRMWKGPVPSR